MVMVMLLKNGTMLLSSVGAATSSALVVLPLCNWYHFCKKKEVGMICIHPLLPSSFTIDTMMERAI